MKRIVRAVASPVQCIGFRMAGLVASEVTPLSDPADIGDALLLAAGVPDTGILLVEQSVFDAAPELVRRDLEHRASPIVVTVPSPAFEHAPAAAEDYILELLRRAIGYRVRL